MNESKTFQKYKLMGPYHWRALSRGIFAHDLFTATRYATALKLADVMDGETVCDFGCGDGALTFLLRKGNPKSVVYGLEPEPTGRTLAAAEFERRQLDAIFLDASDQIPNQSVDVVVCCDVIEHVVDPESLLSEIRRILKPGGRCVLATPVRMDECPLDSEHTHEFFPNELDKLVSTRFEIVRRAFSSWVGIVEFSQFAPRIFLGHPISSYFLNILSLWFGINLFDSFNPLGRHWCTQTLLCRNNLPVQS